jgi:broad specificity phosphatase PhoE
MNDKRPIIYLVRHAETAWSLTGQQKKELEGVVAREGYR